MKTNVKDAYPILMRVIVKRLRAAGWPHHQLWKKARELTPSYVSNNLRVKRFAMDYVVPPAPPKPTKPKPVCFIIGNNAATLKVVKKSDKFAPRFSGTQEECMDVIKRAVAQWFTLPVGREIEHITGAKMEMIEEASVKTLKPDAKQA